jgi:hypothetical protein
MNSFAMNNTWPISVHTRASLRSFVSRQSAAYGIDADAAMSDARVWTDIGQVLFMAKEFIYIG